MQTNISSGIPVSSFLYVIFHMNILPSTFDITAFCSKFSICSVKRSVMYKRKEILPLEVWDHLSWHTCNQNAMILDHQEVYKHVGLFKELKLEYTTLAQNETLPILHS